jgi:hypothetical protein
MTTPASPVSSRSRWGARAALAGVVVVLGLLALLVLVSLRAPVQRGALDPDAPGPQGSRALAVLLGNHGHPVTEVSSSEDALARASNGDVTILVPFPYNLAPTTLRKLAALPATVRVVLVEPDSSSVDELEVGVSVSGGGLPDVLEPNCSLPEAESAGNADLGGLAFESDVNGFTTCYDKSLAVLQRSGRAELVLLGSDDPLTNESLAHHGDAALSIGLLAAHRSVVWLQKTKPEPVAAAQSQSLTDLLPGWVPVSFTMLAVAAVLTAFWRGRRLAAPVAEPLPVVVRSTETVEGRARLYQRARARPEAAAALRSAALGRLRPILGLGSQPEPSEVCAAAAERTGWAAEAVGSVLYGPPPADDRALVELAGGLDALVSAVTTNGKLPVNTDEGRPS